MSRTRVTQARRNVMASTVMAMVLALVGFSVAPALGVDVHEPHIGTTCEAGGLWHFVHNQIPLDTDAGTLTAEFSGSGIVVVQANKVLRSTQHYDVEAAGELLAASDDIAEGKLVLSHVDCETTTTTKATTTTKPSTTTTATTKPTTTSSSVVVSSSSTTSTTKPDGTTSTTKRDGTTTTTKHDHGSTSTTKHDHGSTSTTKADGSTTKPTSTTLRDGGRSAGKAVLAVDEVSHLKG